MFALPPKPAAGQENKPNSEQEANIPHVTPNILPCCIHHDGPVPVSRRYWDPRRDEGNDDHATAYFRGRKLHSRRVAIPDGYYGLLASPSSNTLPSSRQKQGPGRDNGTESGMAGPVNDEEENEEDEDEEEDVPTTLITPHSRFSHIELWGHERRPEADDVFARGVGEWIRFAEAIHASGATSAGAESECEGGTEAETNGAQERDGGPMDTDAQ